jgi:large subunit ribosomal protein L31
VTVQGLNSCGKTIRHRRGEIMREGIHPDYYQANVTCNCGNTFVTGSTKQEIHVEICSKCHPFYTGQQKANQARGRIEQFNKKYGM